MANKEQARGGKDKKTAKSAIKEEKKAGPTAVTPKVVKKDLGRSVILACTCAHEDQDFFYGRSMRVFNVGAQHRVCTVCGAKK